MGETVPIALASASVLASLEQRSAERESSEFQARTEEFNARISDLQAADAIRRGSRKSDEQKIKTKRLIGAQRASLAAQGIDIDTGSALDVQLETAEFGALDAITIKNNARRESLGFKAQSVASRSRADFSRVRGRARGARTLLTGGLQALRSSRSLSTRKKK